MSGGTVYGTTSPITERPPTADELEQAAALEAGLREEALFEGVEEAQAREAVLVNLNDLVRSWIVDVGKAKMSEDVAKQTGGGIYTSGSYRLGVHGPGADIDMVCVAPQHITREEFFSGLVPRLRSRFEVTELQPVPDAYVPVIKFRFDRVQIDMLFARLAVPAIDSSFDILADSNLKNVDDKTQRSINGPRVADKLLRLVPNAENFRLTLRCIKIWAKRRGVVGNAIGFPGGVALAILTARICQLYPTMPASKLVLNFFSFYSIWECGWERPIYLTEPIDLHYGFRVWNPKVEGSLDRKDVMAVVTPAYPAMNSTYNVSVATLKVIKQEIDRGKEICERIMKKEQSWKDLWGPLEFFLPPARGSTIGCCAPSGECVNDVGGGSGSFRHFIMVKATADNESDFVRWTGFVESRLRHLTARLEAIVDVRPYPRMFLPAEGIADVEKGDSSDGPKVKKEEEDGDRSEGEKTEKVEKKEEQQEEGGEPASAPTDVLASVKKEPAPEPSEGMKEEEEEDRPPERQKEEEEVAPQGEEQEQPKKEEEEEEAAPAAGKRERSEEGEEGSAVKKMRTEGAEGDAEKGDADADAQPEAVPQIHTGYYFFGGPKVMNLSAAVEFFMGQLEALPDRTEGMQSEVVVVRSGMLPTFVLSERERTEILELTEREEQARKRRAALEAAKTAGQAVATVPSSAAPAQPVVTAPPPTPMAVVGAGALVPAAGTSSAVTTTTAPQKTLIPVAGAGPPLSPREPTKRGLSLTDMLIMRRKGLA